LLTFFAITAGTAFWNYFKTPPALAEEGNDAIELKASAARAGGTGA
jgi:hypothetical protein